MDIDQLRTLLEVNRTRHFRLAAEALYVTQSTVSARIKKLEEELGVTLFRRQSRRVQITPQGQRMLRYAEGMLALWRRARQDLALAEGDREQLAVGGLFSLWDIFLQGWLAALRRHHPELALLAESHDHDFLLRRLLDGALDLIFLYEPPQLEELLIEEVGSVSLVLVATRPGLSPAQALSEGYLQVDWGHSFALQHSRQFPDGPPPAGRMNQARLALRHLLDCGGSAYLAEQTVAGALAEGRLHPVEGAPRMARRAYAVYQRRGARARLVGEALELLRQVPDGRHDVAGTAARALGGD